LGADFPICSGSARSALCRCPRGSSSRLRATSTSSPSSFRACPSSRSRFAASFNFSSLVRRKRARKGSQRADKVSLSLAVPVAKPGDGAVCHISGSHAHARSSPPRPRTCWWHFNIVIPTWPWSICSRTSIRSLHPLA
jgi:hypothetical protein